MRDERDKQGQKLSHIFGKADSKVSEQQSVTPGTRGQAAWILAHRLCKLGYIRNVDEDRPAVISVNTVFSGLIINEFLARLHDFRDERGDTYGTIGFSLSQMMIYPEAETCVPCRLFARHVGRGDVELPLDMPEFSPRNAP